MKSGVYSGQFSPGPVFCNILLADEINRTSPKTQASLLEAMEERQITVDGRTMPLPALFMVIATQNPVEQLGTYRLPEAQLDRFMMKVSMGYPEKEREEADIVRRALNGEAVKQLAPVTAREDIIEMKKEIQGITVHDDIMDYAVEIARNTRKSRYLTLGASPRAAAGTGAGDRHLDGAGRTLSHLYPGGTGGEGLLHRQARRP